MLPRTLNLRSSLKVRDHVSHPYKITGKIIVFYTLTLTFLDSKQEDKKDSDLRRSKHPPN
jgi:hypothetical protein